MVCKSSKPFPRLLFAEISPDLSFPAPLYPPVICLPHTGQMLCSRLFPCFSSSSGRQRAPPLISSPPPPLLSGTQTFLFLLGQRKISLFSLWFAAFHLCCFFGISGLVAPPPWRRYFVPLVDQTILPLSSISRIQDFGQPLPFLRSFKKKKCGLLCSGYRLTFFYP